MNMFHGSGSSRWVTIAATVLLGALVAGCEGDDGRDGADGIDGTDGAPGAAGPAGTPGINCWDLNQNGVADLATEDTNKDGKVDVNDCRTTGSNDPATFHKTYFTDNPYTSTAQCLNCHGWLAGEVMKTGHWKQEGTVASIVGPVDLRGKIHGKKDLINNFCQAVPSNEGRCSQCHIGIGWVDKNFDFNNPRNIDCLACHDQTGTYKKVQTPSPDGKVPAGGPDPTVDLTKVAQSVGLNDGVPPRYTCVACHSRAGGDDNVKHGDINSRFALNVPDDPANPNDDPFDRTEDVHMGVDGGNMACVACHQVDKGAAGNVQSHGIGGFMYHSVDEGVMKDCTDCHPDRTSIHAATSAALVVNLGAHKRLACQACHIPAIARKVSTYTDWRWSMAGLASRPAECAAEPVGTGNRPTWVQIKGCFKWGTGVRPELRYYNGQWNRRVMGVSDKYTTTPVDLGSPAATYKDADAMIYPFKKMTGNQPADKTSKTVLVPHLWGKVTGPNPFWRPAGATTGYFNWDLSLVDGAAYSGAYKAENQQVYSGTYEFVDTVMLLKVDHEIPPAEQALGMGSRCTDCHGKNTAGKDQVDWVALGWSADPLSGGTRPD
jgi:octaheme c-type cytochrome (tetrathionate reductase family)